MRPLIWTTTVAVLALGACAPTTLRHPTAYGTDCEALSADVTCVRVFYGSNRALGAPVVGDQEMDVDTVAPGDAGRLILGRADVWLPRLTADGTPRERGETPVLRGEPPSDPDLLERYVMITRITTQGRERFVEELSDAMDSSNSPDSILLFVHGFSVGFESALVRSAQLTVDLREDDRFDPGAPVLFTWPSRGSTTPWAYYADQRSADAAVEHLLAFLDLLLTDVAPGRINIIAHSMGNRVLTEALEDYAERYLTQGSRPDVEFRIIMAAADVERDVFGLVAGKLDILEPNVTLYASDRDAALWVSRLLNQSPRLGQTDRNRPWIREADGYLTVDATEVSSALYGAGHAYYSDSPFILNDIRCALADQPVEARALLEARFEGRPEAPVYFRTSPEAAAEDLNCSLRRRTTLETDDRPFVPPSAPAPPPPTAPAAPSPPPPPPPPPQVVAPLQLTAYFDTGSAEITPQAAGVIDAAAVRVQRDGARQILIVGHTDAQGDAAFNERLALRRAQAVVEALVARGVDRALIRIESLGEQRPRVASPDDAPEPLNRRVEITIF